MNNLIFSPARRVTMAAGILMALAMAPACPVANAVSANPPAKDADLFPDPVVATGKGFEIRRSKLDDVFVIYKSGLVSQGQQLPEAKRAFIRSNLLVHLVVTHVLVSRATDDDKAKVKDLVDSAIAEARKGATSEEAFNAQILATGMTLDQVKERATEEQLCKRILERELKPKIVITDAEIKKFYDDNPTKFELPERVHVSHILISAVDPVTQQPLSPDQKKEKEKLAKSLRDRAMTGEDFEKLVKQYTDDPGSRDKGGEYTFPRGQMVPEFEAAAFSLKTNQISDIVETKFGYHIIKLLDRLPPETVTLAKASPDIKDYLTDQEFTKDLPAYLDKVEAEADVKIFDPDNGAPAAPASPPAAPAAKP